MDPEKAHHLTIKGMKVAHQVPGMLSILRALYRTAPNLSLQQNIAGVTFDNPIGLAAGLDKNAEAVPSFSSLGFGFMEVGTVTPKAQPGNEKPRMFRLPDDKALINRMGFNNVGAEALRQNLSVMKQRNIPIAINLGKNKNTANEHAEEDYVQGLRILYTYGDFFVINISSPNTPDLRHLQFGEALHKLLDAVTKERDKLQAESKDHKKPIFVKIAPDVNASELKEILQVICLYDIAGMVVSNTTIARNNVTHSHASETGGLSGYPLKNTSTTLIRDVYKITEGKLPIIGSGGIFTGEDAYEKIRAGASLVEIYTALIYEGPKLISKLNKQLSSLLERDGFHHISEAIGVDVE